MVHSFVRSLISSFGPFIQFRITDSFFLPIYEAVAMSMSIISTEFSWELGADGAFRFARCHCGTLNPKGYYRCLKNYLCHFGGFLIILIV